MRKQDKVEKGGLKPRVAPFVHHTHPGTERSVHLCGVCKLTGRTVERVVP